MCIESAKKIKILLVEDNLVNCEVAVDMLDELGFHVDVANNGQLAVDLFDASQHALILMDCEMPVMDGFTSTMLLRDNEERLNIKPTPIIALTAHALTGAKDKCFASGMNDFLSKPFNMMTLHNMLNKWLLKEKDDSIAVPDPVNIEASDDISGSFPVNADVLDQDVIQRLCSRQKENGSSLATKLISVYLEQSSRLLGELAEATQQLDVETVREIAHALKSSSMNVGARGLSDLCREIEHDCIQGTIERSHIEQVYVIYSDVEKALKDVLK